MHKWGIAREAKSLALQIDRMKALSPEECGIYIEDIRARIARMGFTFEDVVKAGVNRLGRIPAAMAKTVEEEPEPVSFVTTRNWRDEIEEALAMRSDHMSWTDRTFLEVMLAEGEVTSRFLSAIEAIVSNAYVQEYWAEKEWEENHRENGSPPTEQLELGV